MDMFQVHVMADLTEWRVIAGFRYPDSATIRKQLTPDGQAEFTEPMGMVFTTGLQALLNLDKKFKKRRKRKDEEQIYEKTDSKGFSVHR